VTVVPPGVDVELWRRADARDPRRARLGVLFVGGDLKRKGGDLLLEAAERLRADPAVPPFDLHLVTRSEVEPRDGVVVHRLSPNSPELIALYKSCDVFCLPTLGDCLPMVLSEAGAAGLALIATDVGAIHEVVRDGQTGLLVGPGDLDGLTAALRRVLTDEQLRRKLGEAAAEHVRSAYDAAANAAQLCELLVGLR
jgi:glycosyltransferase involved in cell wall biosynthesis